MITYESIITEELDLLRLDIIQASKTAGQEASGRTYSKILIERLTELTGELTAPIHIGTLASGRQGGKVPYNFRLVIMEWAKNKGISFEKEEDFEKWAEAVAWNIQRNGTKLYQKNKGQQNPNIFEIPIDACIERITDRIALATQKDFTNRIDDFINNWYN